MNRRKQIKREQEIKIYIKRGRERESIRTQVHAIRSSCNKKKNLACFINAASLSQLQSMRILNYSTKRKRKKKRKKKEEKA